MEGIMSNIKELEILLLDFLKYRNERTKSNQLTQVNYSSQAVTASNNQLVTNMRDSLNQVAIGIKDQSYQHGIKGDLNKKINPFIMEVLDNTEYEGSPLYHDHLSREFIAQLVDQVIHKVKHTFNDIEEIALEMPYGLWGRFRILKSLVELAVLNEIFCFRRPRYGLSKDTSCECNDKVF